MSKSKRLSAILLITITLVLSGAAVSARTVGMLTGIGGLGDQSFNDMIYAGIIRAKQEYGLKIIVQDLEKTDLAHEKAMERLIDSNVDIIIAGGYNFQAVVDDYAKRYPDKYFIIHDAMIQGHPNVVSIYYNVMEGSFLAGVLAALMTQTKSVGFIGGVDVPIMHEFRSGFRAGVLHTRSDTVLYEKFASRSPDLSGFKNPDLGYLLAMEQYQKGVDIIYSAAGLTGNGVLQAARESGKFAIGVDSDQDHLAKGHVLTSMMKRLDVVTYRELSEIIGSRFKPGVKHYGLKDNGVGLSPMTYTRHLIPDSIIDTVETIRRRIVTGELDVSRIVSSLDPDGCGE